MTTIYTNIHALNAIEALKVNSRDMGTVMRQLTTGKRINSAEDDPTGVALVARMTQQIRSLDQAVSNTGDAVALLQTVDGGATAITRLLTRMRELTLQAMNGTVTPEQRSYLNIEFQQLKQEIIRTSESTNWNGLNVLNGTAGESIGPGLKERISANGTFVANAAGTVDGVSPMEANDVVINDWPVPASYSLDDNVSPAGNASASAIAKAAAINRITDQTGIRATVVSTVMSGAAMDPVLVNGGTTTGAVMINGYTSPTFTTVVGDATGSRMSVIDEINRMTYLTGVVAVDTGIDNAGIRLEAKDGRNIEVAFSPQDGSTAAQFSARTGLVAGVQTGTYVLEADKYTPVTVRATAGGVLARSGLPEGDFAFNRIAVQAAPRAMAGSAGDVKRLQAGDLVINGTPIRATTLFDDSQTDETAPGSDRLASATAVASAINASTVNTGVTATVIPASTVGETVDVTSPASGLHSLYINGNEVSVFMTQGEEPRDRRAAVVDAINWQGGQLGVKAVDNGFGVTVTAIDGCNLSIWYDSADAGLSAASFGLDPAVVLGTDITVNPLAGINTLYGSVKLSAIVSMRAEPGINSKDGIFPIGRIEVDAGTNGLGPDSNFKALGFSEGMYGQELDPPATRLRFQVGTETDQALTIDLADFGNHGAITRPLTSDVDDDVATIRIDTLEDAQTVLGIIDTVVQNIGKAQTDIGAVVVRLQEAIDNLNTVTVNVRESRSRVEDTDYNAASAELARTQIIQQAATAILAQANVSQETVLKLLK
jgi:flagellin